MALQLVSALCSVALLFTLALGLPVQTGEVNIVPVRITVKNDFNAMSPSYQSSVPEGGVLYGVLKRLENSKSGFTFNVTISDNYGLYLESVNGVTESKAKQTYWQLLSEHDGIAKELDVGVGCYQPKPNEHIILKYTTWSKDSNDSIF